MCVCACVCTFRFSENGKREKQIRTAERKNCCRTGMYKGYGFIHDARKRYHRCHDMQYSHNDTKYINLVHTHYTHSVSEIETFDFSILFIYIRRGEYKTYYAYSIDTIRM